ATPARMRFCPVDLPESWRRAFAHGRLRTMPGEQLFPLGGSATGTTLLAWSRTVTGADVSSAVVEFRGRERVRTVLRLGPQDTATSTSSSFDGRWYVFGVVRSTDLGHGEVYAWDSRAAGAPVRLARHRVGRDGAAVRTPSTPVVHAGHAAWTQPVDDAGARRELHLYSLRDGRGSVVRRGPVAPPARIGTLLVWGEPTEAGSDPRWRAADFATGHPAPRPGARAAVLGASSVAADDDGGTVAWTSGRTVYAWRAGWPEPRIVFDAPATGNPVDRAQVAGPLVTFGDPTAQYTVDLRTGGYARITPEGGGSTLGWGSQLAVTFPPSSKLAGDARSSVVDVRDLPPLPGCP
ncbi:MAG TPA: hypothetical protein VNV66_17890, partial [Pilimelia sp.]|nr:hypothetical protein [Pilimelia sp.]